jgi:hypothetical protein
MPCHTDPPSARELAEQEARLLLDEADIGRKMKRDEYQLPSSKRYDRSLDALTRELCEWCKTHDVTKFSLEMQLWWRDHQEADRRHAEEDRKAGEEAKLKKAALAKLTPAERKALRLER